MMNTSNYQTDDSGYSADSCASSFSNNNVLSNQLKSTNLDDKLNETNYFLLDNLNRHLNQPPFEQQINNYELTNNDSLIKGQNLVEKINNSQNIGHHTKKSSTDLDQTILQCKNEQSIKNQLNIKTNFVDQNKTNKLGAKEFDQNNETQLINAMNNQNLEHLNENQTELKVNTELNNQIQQDYSINQQDTDNYQVMYNIQTPLIQTTLDAMDIYYPTTDLEYPLTIKDSTRHLESSNYSQSIDNKNAESVYHHSFQTDNICTNLVGPGAMNTVCDDYVVTFL